MLRPVIRTQLAAPNFAHQLPTYRLLSTTSPAQDARAGPSANAPAKPHTIDPRWLTMIKRRIGKCMMFGLKPDQIDEGGKILQQLANDWRELIAGSEGFLTDKKRRSLFRHNVVWGEQVGDSCLYMDLQDVSELLLMSGSFGGLLGYYGKSFTCYIEPGPKLTVILGYALKSKSAFYFAVQTPLY